MSSYLSRMFSSKPKELSVELGGYTIYSDDIIVYKDKYDKEYKEYKAKVVLESSIDEDDNVDNVINLHLINRKHGIEFKGDTIITLNSNEFNNFYDITSYTPASIHRRGGRKSKKYGRRKSRKQKTYRRRRR